ncbi:MAG: manganese efflux pump [Desulfomonile tiedjei]|uniref:Putative manganese efflux pump MntP n=1 Tax=Desulfomonile tiedjei TaxID=2358 RepID=A0A9D6V103_9BACT|nr:manganese efflux pump [Desulfomonile tiedjei]
MDALTLLGTAVALGMDAFAVAAAVAAGLRALTNRHLFRLIWHFGLFQSLMTTAGWFGGEGLSLMMGDLSAWIAFALLFLLGLNMIRQSVHPESRSESSDPTRGLSLVALSVATSIDALAVGLSLGLINIDILVPALVIGCTALVMTFAGMRLGDKVGSHMGQWAERVGGVVLMIIGVRILLEKLIL